MLDNYHFAILTCTVYYPAGFQRVPLCTLHVSIALQSYTFFTKNVQNVLLFYSSSQRIEYDSNNFAGICISVAVLRQSLIAARTSSIISDASWCSIM